VDAAGRTASPGRASRPGPASSLQTALLQVGLL